MRIMQFQMLLMASIANILLQSGCITTAESPRERISINDDWRFHKYGAEEKADGPIYDVRPEVKEGDKSVVADEMPTEAVEVEATQAVLKPWILPTGNNMLLAGNARPETNPIIKDLFTADPAPLVHNDTVYLYVGHDEAKGKEMFTMWEWLCFSSKDMKAWTPHGPIMRVTDFKWAVRDAWAAQAVERNGKFYFYATVQHDNTHPGKAIGVAVSDSPTGPFVDARGTALVTDRMTPSPNAWDDIDPTVFIDDDGTAWLAWGNPSCYLARLKPNMIELDGPIQKIHLPNYTEGPWLHKRGNMYYLTYAAFAHQGMWEKICYAMAPKITGPWTYRGILTDQAKNSYTIHPGIIEFHGQWYFFYHNAALTLPNGEKGGLGRRSVCVEYLYYNPDGTIQPIKQTLEGVTVPPKATPTSAGKAVRQDQADAANVSSAGVTVTQNAGYDPTNWPGSPILSTTRDPYNTATEAVSFNRAAGVTNIGQTFTVGEDSKLQRISLFAGDGFGTGPGNTVTLALYDLGSQDASSPSSLNSYSAETNLLGASKGLQVAYKPQAPGLLVFDFAGPNQVILKAGHAYAFELQGLRKSAPLFWRRTKKDAYQGGAAYSDRAVIDEKSNQCDFAMAVYGVRVSDDAAHDPEDSSKPTEAVEVEATQAVLKPWILPTGNDFIKDPAKRYVRPDGNPGSDFPFVQSDFDDSSWQSVNLPHDWAIKGPFQKGWGAEVDGSMGRLPSPGVAWYRKKLDIPASDAGKSIFLDVDGAMSYAIVWLNGKLVGGWPYGYASWRIDLTPYIVPGCENQLAIRLDNPPSLSRWYPGGGIYRNVWLTKTRPVHVGQWGTYVRTRQVSLSSATVDLDVTIDNDSRQNATVSVATQIFTLDAEGRETGDAVASIESVETPVAAGASATVKESVVIANPKLWGPTPQQQPNRYVAVTTLMQGDKVIDTYKTPFGIRGVRFDPDWGVYINGERVYLKGVNMHHDLGALGAAFNYRAAERQLEMLREMGCNAIRMAHNPPAPELLELTDRMGFLVMDEIFDVWERKKTPLDFHLIFPDWHEQDMRAFVRRDRNHPSVIMWSFGNEVGEQYTAEQGAAVAKRLHDIVKQEDTTRPTTTAMNWAKPNMPLPEVPDVISLNYQGEGIRQDPEFEGTDRIRTPPQYPAFHEKFPNKVIISSETAHALSSRGIYLFPVSREISGPVRDGRGGDSKIRHVSAYELHATDYGSSADKVFASIERHPYVAGEFVWTGWDYLGEPTPYYDSRSSYGGIIDLAGFKKDRFYIYQAHWRPELPMAHILPHWTWPERVGQITPVHVFTSGDEAELFLNGKSLGRKKKGQYEYRLRWDDVKYEPGELKVVAFKDGKIWATDIMRTAGGACQMDLKPDRATISADGRDLSFVTLTVQDSNGIMVPRANNLIRFSVGGPGEIVATDNGDPTNLVPFYSHEREAFSGLALVIIRSKPHKSGQITITAKSPGLKEAQVVVKSQ